MEQTYFQTATMLPASKRGALLPRPQGDGMDSETLRIRELTPSRSTSTPPRNRQNLASSPRTATVSKNEKPHFIPHEPVKGAVKPLLVSTKQLASSSPDSFSVLSDSRQISPKRNLQEKTLDSSINSWTKQNPPQVISCKNNYNYYTGSAECLEHQQCQSWLNTDSVKTKVPLYNTPGHLSHSSYKMIEKQQLFLGQPTSSPPPNSSISAPEADTVKISMVKSGSRSLHQGNADVASGHQVALSMNEVLEEVRQVEGDARSASMADLEKLNDEINELRCELENQCKVNTDLKKLLVASMGDDLHHKVDRLVQDKQQLAAEVGTYTKKLYQDYEDIDKLSIQADIWRSKFKASRVMTDQLKWKNTQLTQNHQGAHQALQRLLQERQQIKEWLSQTHRFLYQVKTAFEPKNAVHPARTGPQTLLSLAQTNLQLADNIKFRLLGPLLSGEDGVGAGTVDALSPAEAYAFQVLSTPTPTDSDELLASSISMLYTVTERHARFHPAVNHDNLTFNVCCRCKGEIQLV